MRAAGIAMIGALLALPAAAADRGAQLYRERCAACHGDAGAGDGPAAAALDPKPRNFRAPEFWEHRPRAQLRLAIRDGRPGTMMAGFKDVLTDEEIEAVIDFIVTLKGTAPLDANRGDGQVPDARPGEDQARAPDRP